MSEPNYSISWGYPGARPILLAGSFRCSLTDEEANEWTAQCLQSREYSEWIDTRRRADASVEFPVETLVRAEAAMYWLARYWYETNIKPKQKEAKHE